MTCIKDEPRPTLRNDTPMGARRDKEARKTHSHMEENRGEGKINAWMEIGRPASIVAQDGEVASRPYVLTGCKKQSECEDC